MGDDQFFTVLQLVSSLSYPFLPHDLDFPVIYMLRDHRLYEKTAK
jgi:hypothetical protein